MESKSATGSHVSPTRDYKADFEGDATYTEDNTFQDAQDMRRLGNQQELKRTFHSLAVLGLTSILVQTWTGVMFITPLLFYPRQNLTDGRQGTIWEFFATWIFQVPMIASLAEMASMAPTAAGQYGWISEFAPSSIQKSLSYVCGWLAALGWQTFIAGTAYGVAGQVTTLISVARPEYSPALWHITLIMIAVGLIAIAFNIFAARRMPLFEGIILIAYIVGFFIVIIPLWTLAPKVPAMEVFTKFENFGGWSSIGAACVVGQTAAALSFFGFDSAAHISEEVKNASLAVPRMMMFALALNGALGFVMVITFCFILQDVNTQIVQSESPFPWIQVFGSATSTGWAIGMTTPIMLTNFMACINSVMAASRQIWSFARDEGVPFSGRITKIVKIDSTPVPITSMMVSLFVLIIIALLNLAGSKIINSLIGLLGGAIGTTYIISISCVLWRRTFSGKALPHAKWSLGRLGTPINIIAILYQSLATITGFFPVINNSGVQGMNWSIVVFGGVAILCGLNYAITGRHTYKGPVVRILKDE